MHQLNDGLINTTPATMILIADCGSTKCDWSILENENITTTSSTGINPFFHSIEEIKNGIAHNPQLEDIKLLVTKVYFLGAGCSSEEKQNIVLKALGLVFTNAEISVKHDLLGAAYATYKGEPSITGILGTGSNSCYFDGKQLIEKTPSLGFIIGDEGSGGYFGKKLVTAYCYGWLPKNISKDFEKTFQKSIPELIHRVNSEPHANAFLASMMPFIYQYKNVPFIKKMLNDGMLEYFENHILPFEQSKSVKIHFVGSVAHYFSENIHTVAKKLHLNIGQIIQKPGPKVVAYFKSYVLNKSV